MTFSTDDESSTGILDSGMRTPGWMVVAVLAGAVALMTPILSINEIEVSRAAAFTISVYFVLIGFFSFNFDPRVARIYVLLLWVALGLGLLLGGQGGELVSWLILGVAGLGGAEILSRACGSIRATAVTDPLTGLQNRVGLIAESDRAITICRRLDQPLSVVHIDLDGFKQVNDREGHAQGDRILQQCADNWTGVIRAGDILARIGGDEFLLVLPGSNSSDARRLMGVLKKVSPIDWSFGVAELAPSEELQACVDRADAELYTQKYAGERSPILD